MVVAGVSDPIFSAPSNVAFAVGGADGVLTTTGFSSLVQSPHGLASKSDAIPCSISAVRLSAPTSSGMVKLIDSFILFVPVLLLTGSTLIYKIEAVNIKTGEI